MTTPVIPTDSQELAEFIADKKNRDAVFGPDVDPTITVEFLNNYARATNKADKGIQQQISSGIQETWANFLKDHAEELGTLLRPGDTAPTADKMLNSLKMYRGHGATRNPNAQGAALDGMYDAPSDYFKTIWHLNQDRGVQGTATYDRIKKMKNALSSQTPADGGFLIPETLRSELLRESLETAIVRPRARVIPMDTLRVGIPALDSTSNASSVYGGIVAYWTEEAAALVNSSPTFARVVLEAKKLTAYTEVPNELMEDSMMSFNALIAEMFPEALAWYEDAAFLAGTGVGEPLGVFNALNAAIVAAAAEPGQLTNTILWENIINMYSRMLPAALNRAVWVASIDTFPQLATMALSVGTGGSAVWLGQGGEGTPPVSILGRPVLFTEKTSRLGTQGDINFVDFGHYLIGDRQAMTAMSSPHYKFGNDVTAFRIIERVDGRPWLQSAITPKNSGPTLSPYVSLATRP